MNLAWVADHDQASAHELAAQVGAEVGAFEDILSNPECDAILVASSTSSHLANVLAALQAGKAVFCEKPLSLSSDSLAAALPELERPGAPPLMIGFNRRFDPHLAALNTKLQAGEIGTVETVHIINHDPAAPSLDFIPRSGGLFKDFTVHDFDTLSWLLREDIVEVFAMASCLVDPAIGDLDDVDTAKVVVRSHSGAIGVVSNSRRSGYGYDQRVEVFGSRGALQLGNVRSDSVARLDEGGSRQSPIEYSFAERYAAAYCDELDHFADVVEHGVTPAVGVRDALRAIRLAEAAAQSLASGAASAPVQQVLT